LQSTEQFHHVRFAAQFAEYAANIEEDGFGFFHTRSIGFQLRRRTFQENMYALRREAKIIFDQQILGTPSFQFHFTK
jgi:hypothetical protein